MSISQQIDFVRNGGETRRFHTWPVLRQQTVAEHSFHVAMIIYLVAGQDEPGVRPALLMAALADDLAEWQVGDIPSPAKRRVGTLINHDNFRGAWGMMEEAILAEQGLDFDTFLTAEERQLLKFADTCEGALYCIRERQMGNKLIAPCFHNYYKYIKEVIDVSKQPQVALLDHIIDMWEQANESE